MSRVQRFERFDSSSLKSPVRMDNGFLKVEGRIARIGIQEYQDASGKTHRELRLPEEVFDADSLASFKQVPVTNRHPPGMLTAKNTKKYAVGNVGESVRKDDTFVAAPLMITDEEAILAVEAGRSQLSNGYTCRLDDTTAELVAKYGPHEKVQREIRGNHVALVDIGRAGPEACLRLDSNDSASSGFADVNRSVVPSFNDNGDYPMVKMNLDGFSLDVADDNAKSIIEKAIATARKDEADKAQKTIADIQLKLDIATAQNKADAERLAAMPAMVNAAAGRLASVQGMARKYLGLNEKLDGKTETEIKKLVIAKLLPDVVTEGRTDEVIDAVYDAALKGAPKEVAAIDAARAGVTDLKLVKADEQAASDPETARENMIKRDLQANVKARR